MKVIYINNFHYQKGGSETVYFNTANIMQKHGHDICFFSFVDTKNIPCKQTEYFVDKGGRTKQLVSYFYNIDAARKLEKLLLKEKPDIAHVHLFWGGLSPSIFSVLKKYRIPLVHTAHDYRMVCPAYAFKDGLGNTCERCKRWNFYQCAFHKCSKGNMVKSILMATEMYGRQLFFNPVQNIDGFIFVSHFSEMKHIEHNSSFADAKHIVLYNYTSPLLHPVISKNYNYFLFFGRLSYEKGIKTLINVFIKHPEFELKIIGTGPLEEDLKASMYNHPNIKLLGYKSGNELQDLVRKARFVFVPSECFENNPMTIVESFSLGTPVIGSKIGGIPEIIEEGKTGYLFESGNLIELEKALLKAFNVSDEVYINMCKDAYRFYHEHFSADNYYKKLMGFYNEIISSYNK